MVNQIRVKVRYFEILIVVIVGILIFSACSSDAGDNTDSKVDTSAQNTIVTTFYPIEFIVSQIVGDEFNVENVTPIGAPAHDFELSPSATQSVLEAKLAIVLGEGFQPAIEETASAREEDALVLMDELEESHSDEQSYGAIIPARLAHGDEDGEHSDEKGHEDHGHEHESEDPHIWLDPVAMQEVVDAVVNAIVEIDANNKDKYLDNAESLKENLDKLDREYTLSLENCQLDTFVTSHDAFSRLAQRYELNQAPIAGFSPENEPSPERMSQIVEIVDEKGIDTIFSEELVSQKVADSLSSEAGVKVEILSPIESLTEQQVEDGDDYFSIMNSNLVALKSALKCDSA